MPLESKGMRPAPGARCAKCAKRHLSKLKCLNHLVGFLVPVYVERLTTDVPDNLCHMTTYYPWTQCVGH